MFLDEERFARQMAIFGKEGQKKIQDTAVAHVGFGGLGTFSFPETCLLGVKKHFVIEHECFSKTNRNRYMGFRHDDIDPVTSNGIEKALVAERVANSIDPTIEVNLIRNRLESQAAFAAIKAADVVIGTLDSDGARSILNELCIAYGKPYIDIASEVFPDGTFGGRVAVVMNGDGCLNCMGDGLDQDEVRRYMTGEDQLQNEAAVYGVDKKYLSAGSGPSVVHLNGIVASLGMLEFQTLVTGDQPCRYLNFRGHIRTLTKGEKPAPGKCYHCSQHGKGGKADVERYLKIFMK